MNPSNIRHALRALALIPLVVVPAVAQEPATINVQNTKAGQVQVVPIGAATGWARSSVNAAIFRTNSLVTYGDTQYTAFYDGDSNVVVAKRKLGSSEWEVRKTQYQGQVRDAHNGISIGVDGNGVLHMAWDLHNQKLRYVRSVAPGSLELTEEMPMTGQNEVRVTYPQFYSMPNGDLMFLYRDGSSGNGNSMLNRFDTTTGTWRAVQHPLIAGGGQRNAYLNTLAIDSKGGIHVSWVWRDTPDVATNHDVCYAYSPDGGQTWRKSTGENYQLPITIANAEVAFAVPRNSELINQTSMTVDGNDRPLIATYWRAQNSEIPQYQLVWHDGEKWRQSQVGNRAMPFRLSGGGTKRIPISRPLVVAGPSDQVHVIFRDEERRNAVSVATTSGPERDRWVVNDLLPQRMGAWEPTYDPSVWQRDKQLHLFIQPVGQGDAETLENIPPQPVQVLEWTPAK